MRSSAYINSPKPSMRINLFTVHIRDRHPSLTPLLKIGLTFVTLELNKAMYLL